MLRTILILGSAVSLATAAEQPLLLSPANDGHLVVVESRCPTFSWAALTGAEGVELRVEQLSSLGNAPAGRVPVLELMLPAGATSWTPSAEICLQRGGQFRWAVRAVAGPWSAAAFFEVAAGPSYEEFRRAMEVVEGYLLTGEAELQAEALAPAGTSDPQLKGLTTDFSVDGAGNATASTLTLTGFDAGFGQLVLQGNTVSRIKNNFDLGRDVLELRAGINALNADADGAGMNLYGYADSLFPGQVKFATGSESGSDYALSLLANQDTVVHRNLSVAGNVGAGNVTVGDTLILQNASSSTVRNSTASGREILELRARTDASGANSDGAGINLYGDADAVGDDYNGGIRLFAGGSTALGILGDQTVRISNEIEFVGNAGGNGLIQKNASAGRDELQLYAARDAFAANSAGAGIHLYGNSDAEHHGNIVFLTGQSGSGDARMIVAGGGGIGGVDSSSRTDTRVTIGNSIFDFVDTLQDTAMLNLKDPQGRPALNISGASSSEGDIAVPDGERMSMGHWSGTVFNEVIAFNSLGAFEVKGDARKPNGGTWDALSDQRLKQDIVAYEQGLDAVLRINPVRFRYNSKSGHDPSQQHVGIIAQEMRDIAPYTVTETELDGETYLQFNGSALTYMLINAVQQQQRQIEELSARLDAMNLSSDR